MKNFLTIAAFITAMPAIAETPMPNPVSELYVMTIQEADLDNGTLTLTGLSRKVIWFADRPERKSGVVKTELFVASWPEGDDNFVVDPPNAVLVGADAAGKEYEIAMKLTEPNWGDDSFTLTVFPLSKPLPKSVKISGAHLFIDEFIGNFSKDSW